MGVVPLDQMHGYIGTETGRSDWFTIDQDRIDRFAEVTEDRQWIHIDPVAAASGPFGATIAHGFMTLSLVSYLSAGTTMAPSGAMMMINYGSDRVRFLNPVTVGSRIRLISTLTDVADRGGGQILITSSTVIEIEGEEKPAMVADLLTLAVMPPS